MANDEREQDTKEQRRRREESGAEIPRGTDEHAEDTGDRSDRGAAGGDPRGVDLDGPLGGERRDPGR